MDEIKENETKQLQWPCKGFTDFWKNGTDKDMFVRFLRKYFEGD